MIIKHLNKISLKNAGFSSLELIVVMALLITLATIGNQKYAAYKRHTNMSEVDIALIYFGKMSSTYLIDHNEFIKKDNEEFISASLSVNSKDNCVKDNPFNITTFPRCEEFPYDIKYSTCGRQMVAVAYNNQKFGCGNKLVDVWKMTVVDGANPNIQHLANSGLAADCNDSTASIDINFEDVCSLSMDLAQTNSASESSSEQADETTENDDSNDQVLADNSNYQNNNDNSIYGSGGSNEPTNENLLDRYLENNEDDESDAIASNNNPNDSVSIYDSGSNSDNNNNNNNSDSTSDSESTNEPEDTIASNSANDNQLTPDGVSLNGDNDQDNSPNDSNSTPDASNHTANNDDNGSNASESSSSNDIARADSNPNNNPQNSPSSTDNNQNLDQSNQDDNNSADDDVAENNTNQSDEIEDESIANDRLRNKRYRKARDEETRFKKKDDKEMEFAEGDFDLASNGGSNNGSGKSTGSSNDSSVSHNKLYKSLGSSAGTGNQSQKKYHLSQEISKDKKQKAKQEIASINLNPVKDFSSELKSHKKPKNMLLSTQTDLLAAELDKKRYSGGIINNIIMKIHGVIFGTKTGVALVLLFFGSLTSIFATKKFLKD